MKIARSSIVSAFLKYMESDLEKAHLFILNSSAIALVVTFLLKVSIGYFRVTTRHY